MRRVLSVSLFLLSLGALLILKPQAAFANSSRANTCAKRFHDCYFGARDSAAREACRQSFLACVRSCPAGNDDDQGE